MAAQAKRDALTALQGRMAVPSGGRWATDVRNTALTRLANMGLPTRRDEYWNYTNPAALIQVDVSGPATQADLAPFAPLGACTVPCVDGVPELVAENPEHAEIESFAAAAMTDLHWAQDLFGTLESAGQTPVERPLATLNTAYAADGLAIHATGVADRPIALAWSSSADSDVMARIMVKVDAGASITILETGQPGARSNVVWEVDVADGASFNHIRIQGPEGARTCANHIFARLGVESAFKSFTATPSGRMTRNECVIDMTGDDATASVAGACVGDGANFHHDDTVFVAHGSLRCESRQVFKKVLRNGATGVFQGKILVKEGAQKTDGYQISQSLLLDDDSQFLAKPELEIYADDVVCSHGSTSGAIDEEALFYLRSRGVGLSDAQNLLTLAFLAEALDEISDEAMSDAVLAVFQTWLGTPV